MKTHIIILALACAMGLMARAAEPSPAPEVALVEVAVCQPEQAQIDTVGFNFASMPLRFHGEPPSLYSLPYSRTLNLPCWKRIWINTGVLTGAFVGTLLVLECLPEDATSWNRAELQKVPLGRRWVDHVLKEGPEWDHDKIVFNYVLHPYAGAAYFMAARSNGLNYYRSLLYSACVSTIGWEFGIEAFMERPSYQDIFITPLVGSLIGEGFYRVKRWIVDNDYRVLGSPILGTVLAFLVDPVNEVVGIFDGNPARRTAAARAHVTMQPVASPRFTGLTLTATF